MRDLKTTLSSGFSKLGLCSTVGVLGFQDERIEYENKVNIKLGKENTG